ncbi:hypothetical protein [Kordiimonas sp.]|uniref:hypothetical protein n=1 Tax=Kordiimonas sp. TaxID=1970157 RepID=UPI003A9428A7
MATCNTCLGTGNIAGSDYEKCGGCGGTGKAGAGTCPYCGGGGMSSIQKRETCYTCFGSGTVRDPEPVSRSSSSSSQKAKPAKKDEGNPLQGLIGIGVFIAVGLMTYKAEEENGVAALIVGAIAGIIAAALYKLIVFIGIVLVIIYFVTEDDKPSRRYDSTPATYETQKAPPKTEKPIALPQLWGPNVYRNFYLNNQCPRTISLALTYLNEQKQWKTDGWWTLSGNARQWLSATDRSIVRVGEGNIYIYAELPDQSYVWVGEDHQAAFRGRTLKMRRFTPTRYATQNGPMGYEVTLTCPELK